MQVLYTPLPLTAVGGECFCADRVEEVWLFIYTQYKREINIVVDVRRTDITSLGQNDGGNGGSTSSTGELPSP